MAFMSVCFVLALDNTILATAIPQISSDFQSLNDIGWYGSSYLIAQMALLPTCGRLYAFYNIKWVYYLSLAVFELGTIVSAVAPNSMTLTSWGERSPASAPQVCSTVPLHIFRSRAVSASCGFMMLVQVAIVLQSYYWPIYFQSVRNTNARDSAVNLLPSIVSNSLGTFCAGWISSNTGHYVPLMWIGAPVLATGGGLYQLIRANSPMGEWIGFQILSGLGYGICSQKPILAVQVVLSNVAFNSALRNVFWVALAAPVLAWIVSWAMDWRKLPDSKTATIQAPPATEASEK
ncbi:Efflux pump aflT [Colletotrichum shisoi]|uniref:Efflux pump aflT n=1 Tax=Colletotrichum shisoi TaxID=2078593 RepID=A0A5Q4BXX5_9PEZI|nr:Efflux pump aflT [Colletotrichum shisoi]